MMISMRFGSRCIYYGSYGIHAILSSLLLLFAAISLVSPVVQAETQRPLAIYLRCTREAGILQAFRLMESLPQAESALTWIADKPVRILFKDMKTLHKGLSQYDALSWISNQGEQVIFINEKHRDAPPEALAAMLAHEALHNDGYNSLSEEVVGWRQEADVWTALKTKNPELAHLPAGKIPLVDRENRIAQEAQLGTLASFVRNNAGYRGLPESSPGFASQAALVQP